MKKVLLTLTLSIMMVLSLGGTVFAEDGDRSGITINGEFNDWKDANGEYIPHQTITYDANKNCFYYAISFRVDNLLYGHIYCYNPENLHTGEGNALTFIKFWPFISETNSDRVFYMYFLDVDENGNIAMDSTQKWDISHRPLEENGTYTYMIGSNWDWKISNNVNSLNEHDAIYGKAVFNISDDVQEVEYVVDLNTVVEQYNKTYNTNKSVNDIGDLEIYYDKCGGKTTIYGTPTGTLGVVACAGIAIGSYYFIDKKRKQH